MNFMYRHFDKNFKCICDIIYKTTFYIKMSIEKRRESIKIINKEYLNDDRWKQANRKTKKTIVGLLLILFQKKS